MLAIDDSNRGVPSILDQHEMLQYIQYYSNKATTAVQNERRYFSFQTCICSKLSEKVSIPQAVKKTKKAGSGARSVLGVRLSGIPNFIYEHKFIFVVHLNFVSGMQLILQQHYTAGEQWNLLRVGEKGESQNSHQNWAHVR